MREQVAGINPKVLVWARERAGQTIGQVAAALKKDSELIQSWEEGKASPTYPQLEALAYKVYKRPIAIFFFPEPPLEPDPEHSFRTLPDFEIEHLSPDTRYKIRDAHAMQIAVSELNQGHNPSQRIIFRDIQVTSNQPAFSIAPQVRDYLGIDLKKQKMEWRTVDEALKGWRQAIEESGVFVFKNTFKQKDVSGFCLYDDEFPIIYLNNSTSRTRQIFTLLHELGHILLKSNGITKKDNDYINALTGNAKRVEVFCNKFAAEVLVPADDFRDQVRDFNLSDELVAKLAREYKVSREVVLRKLLEKSKVSREYYEKKASEWAEEFNEARSNEGGGNYYATQATYLGERFLQLAFRRYYEGAVSLPQLAEYLNVKVSSIPGLEPFAVGQM